MTPAIDARPGSQRPWFGAFAVACRLPLLTVALLLLFPATSRATNPCANGGNPTPLHLGPGDEGGVGGTGIEGVAKSAKGGDREGGVGGTGIEASARPEGGVGGTGVEADGDSAIIGTITGFASICVGGTEVRFDATTRIRIDGADVDAGALAIGQVVQVLATGDEDQVEAHSIDVDHVVAGPITAVDLAARQLEVMGQAVELADTNPIELDDLAVGQWIQVSGLRRDDDVVVASRLDAGEVEGARVSGPLRMVGGRAHVGQVPVQLDEGPEIGAPSSVVAVGRWESGQLVAERVEPDRASALRKIVRRVQIEGYVDRSPTEKLEVGGWPLEIPVDQRKSWDDLTPGKRVQVRAQVDRDGCLVPDGVVLPPSRRVPEGHENPRPLSDPSGGNQPPSQPKAGAQSPPGEVPHGGSPRGGAKSGAMNRPPHHERAPRPPRPERPDIPRAQRPPPRPPKPGGPPPPRPPGPH